jgi:hypothetical protein
MSPTLGYFDPATLEVASAAFSRSWSFIERDPVFKNQDREELRAELGRRIFAVVDSGERDLLRIANRAIHGLREVAPRPARAA